MWAGTSNSCKYSQLTLFVIKITNFVSNHIICMTNPKRTIEDIVIKLFLYKRLIMSALRVYVLKIFKKNFLHEKHPESSNLRVWKQFFYSNHIICMTNQERTIRDIVMKLFTRKGELLAHCEFAF